jgi:hypothetical protein
LQAANTHTNLQPQSQTGKSRFPRALQGNLVLGAIAQLGSEQFVDKRQKRIECAECLTEIPSAQRRPLAKPLERHADVTSSRSEAIIQVYGSGGYPDIV